MLQKIRCIRFGEVLLDENKQAFLLCSNCQTDYRDLQTFRHHLENCNGLEHLIQQNITIAFDSDKGRRLMGKTADEFKEFLIYEPNEVMKVEMANTKQENIEMDLIKIEEELLDPRWYSDITVSPEPQDKILAYKELVEAVTPYVHFKENVKSNISNNTRNAIAKETETSAKYTKLNDTSSKSTLHMNLKQPQITEQKYILNKQISNLNSTATKKLNTIITINNPESNILDVQQLCTNSNIAANSVEKRRPIVTSVENTITHHQLKTFKQNGIKNHNNNTTTLESLPANLATTNKKLNQRNKIEEIQQWTINSGKLSNPITKKRKSIAISMDNALIEPEFKSQFVCHQQTKSTPKILKTTAIPKVQKPKLNQIIKQTTTAPITPTPTLPTPVLITTQKQCMQPMTTIPLANVPAKVKQTEQIVNKLQTLPLTNVPAKVKQTEQIINKLQTLGLQVKRTQPALDMQVKNANSKTDDKTMELLKKLQSKGMKVQIINKNSNSAAVSKAKTTNAVHLGCNANLHAANNQMQQKQHQQQEQQHKEQQKTIINRNLIIKKVK